jgi:spermidine/putrescine transport system permease protein
MKKIFIMLFLSIALLSLPLFYIFCTGFAKPNFMSLVQSTFFSFSLAITATFLSFVFALPSAFAYCYYKSKLVSFTILLLCILPPFILSLLFSNLFFYLGITESFISLSFAHMFSILPYSFIFMVLGLNLVPTGAIYYAKLYASNIIKGYWLFYFPFMKPAVLVAFLLGISVSLSQYILTFMLAKPGFTTLILRMTPYIQSGDVRSAATYGIVFLLNTLLALYLFTRLKNVLSSD